MTQVEEACLYKCEARALELHRIAERHIEETFNPAFFTNYIN